MIDVLMDAVLDTLKMLPFLLGTYLLIEYLEHKASDKLTGALSRMGAWGPVGGAFLGCIPQCGFSVAAANFYAGGVITIGTLLAVFLSTSDEAIPIILAHPDQLHTLWPLILVKLLLAIVVGILTDLVTDIFVKEKKQKHVHDLCEHCDCENDGILRPALRHTVQIFCFLLIVNILLGAGIHYIGEDTISRWLLNGSVLQPFLTALIGFIPNCASSVILTELFLSGSLTFGSVVAGLATGAGLGLAVLFRINKRHMKQNFIIMGILYAVSVAAGLLMNLFL